MSTKTLGEKSRFSALKVDDASSDSDSEPFQKVKSSAKGKRSTTTTSLTPKSGVPSSSGKSQDSIVTAAQKNAKKRARKKNKLLQGSDAPSQSAADLSPLSLPHGAAQLSTSAGGEWQSNPVPRDDDAQFQLDLKLAMEQSNREAEKHREKLRMAGVYHHIAGQSPEPSQDDGNPGMQQVQSSALPSSMSARSTSDARSPAGMTRLSLPQAADEAPVPDAAAAKKERKKKAKAAAAAAGHSNGGLLTSEQETVKVAQNLCAEEQRKTTMFKRMKVVEDDLESVRIAELTDLLEKKDSAIADVVSNLSRMAVQLKEVKCRNKQLCVIMSRGEMSEKCALAQQVEELTVQQKELTDQVSELHTQLEQERSRSKPKSSKKP